MSDESKVVPIKVIRALINQAVTDLNEYADFPVTNQMTGLLFSQAYTDYVTGIDGEIPTYLQWLEVRILAAEAKLERLREAALTAAEYLEMRPNTLLDSKLAAKLRAALETYNGL